MYNAVQIESVKTTSWHFLYLPNWQFSCHLCFRRICAYIGEELKITCPRKYFYPKSSFHAIISSYISFSINNKPNYVWLDYGHGLLIFLLSPQFWLRAMGHIWGFRAFLGECMDGMAWRLDSGDGLLIFLHMMPLWLSGTGQTGDFGAFPGKNALRVWSKILHADGSCPPTELIR